MCSLPRFLESVSEVASEYDRIASDPSLSEQERDELVKNLRVCYATFDELSLTMTYLGNTMNDADNVQPLCDGGENIEVRFINFIIYTNHRPLQLHGAKSFRVFEPSVILKYFLIFLRITICLH